MGRTPASFVYTERLASGKSVLVCPQLSRETVSRARSAGPSARPSSTPASRPSRAGVSPTGACRSPPGGGSRSCSRRSTHRPRPVWTASRPRWCTAATSVRVPCHRSRTTAATTHVVVPVLASTRPYVDDTDEVTVSRLSDRVAQAFTHTKTPRCRGPSHRHRAPSERGRAADVHRGRRVHPLARLAHRPAVPGHRQLLDQRPDHLPPDRPAPGDAAARQQPAVDLALRSLLAALRPRTGRLGDDRVPAAALARGSRLRPADVPPAHAACRRRVRSRPASTSGARSAGCRSATPRPRHGGPMRARGHCCTARTCCPTATWRATCSPRRYCSPTSTRCRPSATPAHSPPETRPIRSASFASGWPAYMATIRSRAPACAPWRRRSRGRPASRSTRRSARHRPRSRWTCRATGGARRSSCPRGGSRRASR